MNFSLQILCFDRILRENFQQLWLFIINIRGKTLSCTIFLDSLDNSVVQLNFFRPSEIICLYRFCFIFIKSLLGNHKRHNQVIMNEEQPTFNYWEVSRWANAIKMIYRAFVSSFCFFLPLKLSPQKKTNDTLRAFDIVS